jgi:hypothetical protein
MTLMDTVFAQQTTTKVGPIGKQRVLESLRPALTMSIILDESKKYMNSIFMVPISKPLTPVIFKCHWFDPQVMRHTHFNLGIVEIRQDSTLPGDDVYIVAQQATQVYYLPYVCQTKEHLKGWDVVYKV